MEGAPGLQGGLGPQRDRGLLGTRGLTCRARRTVRLIPRPIRISKYLMSYGNRRTGGRPGVRGLMGSSRGAGAGRDLGGPGLVVRGWAVSGLAGVGLVGRGSVGRGLAVDGLVVEGPVGSGPVVEDLAVEGPMVEDLAVEGPVVEGPVVERPVVERVAEADLVVGIGPVGRLGRRVPDRLRRSCGRRVRGRRRRGVGRRAEVRGVTAPGRLRAT